MCGYVVHFLGDVDKLDVGAVLANWTEMMRDHHLQLPADMALLFRVVLELQGLGQGVGIDVSLTELAAPYVHEMLSERFEPKQMARQAAHTARSWQQLIETLPAQVTAALDAVCSGKLAVDIGVRDVDGAVDRLVDGVLTSACLLGATQLVARRAGPTIGGFSVAGLRACQRCHGYLASAGEQPAGAPKSCPAGPDDGLGRTPLID